MKVEQFYNKNQFIIKDKNQEKIIFQSYKSTIAKIENKKLTLYENFDYSKTTQKHLYLFIKDYFYCLDYETRTLLQDFEYSKNKRAFLQNLINQNKIEYIN